MKSSDSCNALSPRGLFSLCVRVNHSLSLGGPSVSFLHPCGLCDPTPSLRPWPLRIQRHAPDVTGSIDETHKNPIEFLMPTLTLLVTLC
eukprot:m.35131 g.35131  ORF g.35131 m.35131 type:complete len:89 (-) comp7410_c0_seq1:1550-1816(-)